MSKLACLILTTIITTSSASFIERSAHLSENDQRIFNGPEAKGLDGSKIYSDRERRNTIPKEFTWPEGLIPIKLSNDYTKDETALIKRSIEEFHTQTCVRFKEYAGEQDYLYLSKNQSEPINTCISFGVGRTGGKQLITLNSRCLSKQHVLHELMHAIGFYHEHNRHDRDHFVQINLENVINSNMQFQFEKRPNAEPSELPYDYKSLMHYGSFFFAAIRRKEGYETIAPLQLGGLYEINAVKTTFSELDIQKINNLYNCDQRTILINKDEFMKKKLYGAAAGHVDEDLEL